MGREKAKGEKKSKKEKTRHDKVKRDRSKRKEGKRRGGRRPPTPDSEYDYYSSYYSYSESRSPSPVRDRKRRGDRDRKHRSRSGGRRRRSRTPRRERYSPPPRREPSPPRRVDRGGYIPVPGPRSPSRDGSPPNDWIISTLIDREKARMKRDFVEADKIRDELRQKGVEILERERRWQHRDGRSGVRPNADDKRRID